MLVSVEALINYRGSEFLYSNTRPMSDATTVCSGQNPSHYGVQPRQLAAAAALIPGLCSPGEQSYFSEESEYRHRLYIISTS